jgi:hypothetical protein
MRRLRSRICLLLAVLWVVPVAACGDEGEAPPGTQDDAGGRTDLPDDEQDADPEDAPPEDAPDDEDQGEDADDTANADPEPDIPASEQREQGELCERDARCQSGLCFFIEAGAEQGFCSDYCFSQEDCTATGFECVRLENSGSDGARVCVPIDFCLDADGDGYGVGPNCDGFDCDDEDPDAHPGAPEVCDGVDNDCDGTTDDEPTDAGRRCDSGLPGVCSQGVTFCDNGELVCEPNTPASSEFCDGQDNDCDGQTDEGDDGQALSQRCYNGPEGTEGVGACQAGARVCVDGQTSDCEGQVLPGPELCDGEDNDCDGESDEGNPSGGVACRSEGLGVCARGRTSCEEGFAVCVPLAEASAEVCDGLDNDCDGQADEGDDGQALEAACYDGPDGTLGVGACAAGARMCAEGRLGTCVGQVRPSTEVCDGLDNDCDGQADEGNPAGGFACETGRPGVCARGQTICSEQGTRCEPFFVESAEVCDGLDNDCDGATDEGDDGQPLARSCYDAAVETQGVGVCQAGSSVCEGGEFGACEGQALPQVEACDGLDNDCDGDEDDGNPGGEVPCDTGLQGSCAAGTTACEGGQVACVPVASQRGELCDGLDNDCDGLADEDLDDMPLARGCYDGPRERLGVGVCRAGLEVCASGDYSACAGQVLPSLERCDGLDNDCDGEADEGNPGADVACDTGLQGACARGLTTCRGGEVVCLPVNASVVEVCDGQDNDCDGQTDEDAQGRALERACYDGSQDTLGVGACAAGVQTCRAGDFGVCVGQRLPSQELCDGQDNDCDGSPDDNPPGAGLACATGLDGVCAAGVSVCEGGALGCAATQAATPELCDGLDNDCDGSLDDGFEGLGEPCFAGLGVCQRAGLGVCDPEDPRGEPVCDAAPGQPNVAEACDFSDDDCDGQTDEDFTNEGGVYDDTQNCGSCGIDCGARWPGGASAVHVVPQCVVLGQSAACDYVCEAGYFDLDNLPDNGCEFRPDPTAVYVATPANGGVATTCGAYDRPCSTLALGMARAQTPNAGFNKLIVSDGVYRENLRMTTGISVLGGHSARNWTRSPDVFVTTIQGTTPTPTGPDRVAVDASGVGSAELSGFTVNGERADAGGNSIGVYARDAGVGLLIRNNTVLAGAGGNGAPGVVGSAGQTGVNGANGARNLLSTTCATMAAPAGGAKTCANPNGQGTAAVSGGNGGAPTCPEVTYNNGNFVTPQSGSGAAGTGTNAGAGGAGGTHRMGVNGSNGARICLQGNNGPDPLPGANGRSGTDGGGGTGASGGAVDANGQWRGNGGALGAHGAHGAGGGGGGSAAGLRECTNPTPSIPLNFSTFRTCNTYGQTRYYGSSGGGGGSGGCAGSAGQGGGAGGGSFAILIAFSGAGPSNANQLPEVTGNRLSRSFGGVGGGGGNGGAGGDPGAGANGGAVNTDADSNGAADPFNNCMLQGGKGANGGRGGHGGGGGGGAGGVSYDLYVHNTNNLDRGYQANNTFLVANNVATGGAGGAGGNSDNTAVGTGADGSAGASGQALLVP